MPEATQPLITAWNLDLEASTCEHCGARYLLPRASRPSRGANRPQGSYPPKGYYPPKVYYPPHCPGCFQQALTPHPDGLADLPDACTPEQVIPFTLTGAALEEAIHQFRAGIPYPPVELEPAGLRQRVIPVFLPMWLVDANTTAYWQAEAGRDYEVISHQDSYDVNGRWSSREVREGRVRWEPRVGRIRRTYQNVVAPALEDAALLEKQVGPYDLQAVQPYDPQELVNPKIVGAACVRLPDRTPKESWSETAAAFEKTAAEDCRKACAADRLQRFRWKAQFTRLNWTLLLLPAYTVEYLDDRGQRQSIWINGQTGKVYGARRASVRAAWRTSLIILGIGLLLLLLGLGMSALSEGHPVLEFIALVTTFGGVAAAAGSLAPCIIAWDYNRKHS